MKLTYRGHAYEVPAPVKFSSDSTTQPKIQLSYRGNRYHYTRGCVVSEDAGTDEITATLIYRGSAYKRRLQLSKLYQQFRTINWRHQIPGEG